MNYWHKTLINNEKIILTDQSHYRRKQKKKLSKFKQFILRIYYTWVTEIDYNKMIIKKFENYIYLIYLSKLEKLIC